MSRPDTIDHSPFEQVAGKDEINPSGTSYEPSEYTDIDTQSPSGVPSTQSRMWSMAAFAADAADDAPRASMIAAPRCCTVGMKSLSSHFWSPMRSAAFLPLTSAWKTSGYCVAEWLPQIVILVTSVVCAPALAASCARARLWSRRVIAVNRRGSRCFAFCWAISAWVLAGLPTTRILTSFFALDE